MLLSDGYKLDHRRQYPEGTEYVYSNFTPRNGRDARDKGVIFFGLQYLLQEYFIERANTTFFWRNKEEVVEEYRQFIGDYAGLNDVSHIEELHDLGYLPLVVRSVPEGTFVPYGVPVLTVENTHPRFFWLTNYVETLISCTLWMACTSATKARDYRKVLDEFSAKTSDVPEFVDFQAHDFSMRGMPMIEAAQISGAAHCLSFTGSDCLPSVWFLKEYYNATGFIAGGVPATEHSVMCAGGEEDEDETYERLLTEIYPNGIVSIVSDTWNLWDVLTKIIPGLHLKIMEREGKFVVRPDSGDPADILCGDVTAPGNTPESKGVIQLLWEEFGGTVNSKGYKVLDPHIGTIYGDSITVDRARNICERLEAAGFSSDNVVFGVGSYTYQLVTRDTHGFAMKATWVQINDQGKIIQKRPKTDKGGLKKSAKGRLIVREKHGALELVDNLTPDTQNGYRYADVMEMFWKDGEFYIKTDLDEMRERVRQAA
jgi:nicotinamide phosphoribosyltransferase